MESIRPWGLWPGEEPVIGIEAPVPHPPLPHPEPRQVQAGIPAPIILLLGLLLLFIAFDETELKGGRGAGDQGREL